MLPANIDAIVEPAAREMARALRVVEVAVNSSFSDRPIRTSYYRTESDDEGRQAVLLLHGFDSSCLEWRRLVPQLEALGHDVIALDVLGWGFTERAGVKSFSSKDKRRHLKAFWEQAIGSPVTIVGTSLGAAFAADFAVSFPEAVSRLVLLDPQVLVDGVGPMSMLPRPLAELGVNVLGTRWLRGIANDLSYKDKERCATTDAMEIGRLQVECDNWSNANVEYMLSGGIAVSSKIPKLASQRVLLIWGRDDEIVPPGENVPKLQSMLPDAELVFVDDCGHVPHLEKPAFTASAINSFIVGVAV